MVPDSFLNVPSPASKMKLTHSAAHNGLVPRMSREGTKLCLALASVQVDIIAPKKIDLYASSTGFGRSIWGL
jgi:hypothetical protein